MPEYLAPGVYVEETSFRAKSIEGVGTATTGFVGPARYGPVDLVPEIITSLTEFERVYGDHSQLEFFDCRPAKMHNYLWHAVRVFFEEGGKRLYVSRVFQPGDDKGTASATIPQNAVAASPSGRGAVDPAALEARYPNAILVRARFPGAAGNFRVQFALRRGENILGREQGGNVAVTDALADDDVVWISDAIAPMSPALSAGTLYLATYDKGNQTWRFRSGKDLPAGELRLNDGIGPGRQLRIVTVAVTVIMEDGTTRVWDAMPPDPSHKRGDTPDALIDYFAAEPANLTQARTLPIVVSVGDAIKDGIDFIGALSSEKPDLVLQLNDPKYKDSASVVVRMSGGNDGLRPQPGVYAGRQFGHGRSGLLAFEDLDDISIVAAPGATYDPGGIYSANARAIIGELIGHAERMRYRIAVLDSVNGQKISDVRAMRAQLDSKCAALYYPWVLVLDPVTRTEIPLPPSGFVAGIYARNDTERAVYKAPANEVVTLTLGCEVMLDKTQQDVLNPEGINCFRFFEGRGYRLWGARTISSDPEWKYVNVRRYFAYLEHSIDKGTQWAVFEPNGDALWATVRRAIEDFLFNEWQNGALLGDKPEKAYFVKCDRSTMTRNDLDNGRLVCLIGVAPLKPAEFVIFRIGQWTADRKV